MKILLTVVCGLCCTAVAAGNQEGAGVALLELYTSEGCSSCPPADGLLGQIAEEAQPGVFVLAYHVTYWDYLGWKDSFGNAAFDARQRAYADALDDSVYTPQLIVNGKRVLVGSREGAAREALREALAEKARVTVSLSRDGTGTVVYRLEGALPAKAVLHTALTASPTAIDVRRGENRGRRLKHTAVVRRYRHQPARSDGRVEPFGEPTLPSHGSVVVWVTDGPYGPVLGAAAVALKP